MDKKCERCFLKYWVSAPDSIDPAIGKWYCVISGKWCSATGLECKLTDDNIISFGAAILQAIAGEGRLVLREVCCKTCRHFTPWKYYDGEIMWECGGKGYLNPPKQPCEHWQDQGGE